MPNEFIVKNGLISQGNITISGSITATGGVTVSGSIASASYASNAELLDGLDSTVFTLTSSFNAQTASFTAFTSSMNSFSASILTNVTALNAKTASFATTGSNTFVGAEIISGSLAISGSGTPFTLNTDTLEITGSLLVTGSTTLTGSLLQLGNFTTTGTIIAQTINVQTVTSSIVYSSGSNVFGNSLGNSQTFTGSVLITGSLTIAGASSATSYNGATIFGSTIACSPIGCFATSCATSFIGGTMSGTTIYGSTVVCSPVGKFTSCIDVGGAGTFSGNVTNVSALYVRASGNSDLPFINFSNADGVYNWGRVGGLLQGDGDGSLYFQTKLGGSLGTRLTITSTGASTFSSTITGTTIYGSTAVCSANGLLIGNGGVTATCNYLPKFTSASTIGNSLISDDGTTVSIQRTAGDLELSLLAGSTTVAGNSILGLYAGTGAGNLVPYGTIKVIPETAATNTRAANMLFSTRNSAGTLTESFRIFSTQNVGIGTGATDSGYKLDVNGTGRFSGNLQVTTTSNNGITITTNDVVTLKMTNSTTKNWGFATTNLLVSDFGIYQSNANGGDPISAGTAKLYFNTTGIACFACRVCTPSLTVSGDTSISGTSGTISYFPANPKGTALCTVLLGSMTTADLGYGPQFRFSGTTSGEFIDIGQDKTGGFVVETTDTPRFTITQGGNIGAPSGTNIYNASDIRLKQNITTITCGLCKINALNPVKFNWIHDFEPTENDKDLLGFIAQEVQTVIPEAVENFGKTSIIVGETTIETPLRVNEKFIIPVLVKAIQEQQCTICSQASMINTLKTCLGIN